MMNSMNNDSENLVYTIHTVPVGMFQLGYKHIHNGLYRVRDFPSRQKLVVKEHWPKELATNSYNKKNHWRFSFQIV